MNENEKSSWEYNPDEGSETSQKNHRNHGRDVAWSASEYIDHSHGAEWYILLLTATLAISALVYMITNEIFATGVTVVTGIILGVFASRKPQQVTYKISESGFSIGEKLYDYRLFKSFAVMREGHLNSINLLPLKKFMPPISAYFAPNDEEKVVKALGEHLPYEDRKLDAMDRITRRLKI